MVIYRTGGNSYVVAVFLTMMCAWFSPSANAWTTFSPTQSTASIDQLLAEAGSASALRTERILAQLRGYDRSAYTSVHRQRVATLLHPNRPRMADWLKLAGFLEMTTELRALPDSLFATPELQQAHKLALIRAGDTRLLANLLRNVRTIPVSDDFVYSVVPLLIYTRQRAAMDYLFELILQSPVNCTPADAETPGRISCAFRLMERVAPVLADFPYRLRTSGDLSANDYAQALTVVQDWIRQHRTDYRLLSDRY